MPSANAAGFPGSKRCNSRTLKNVIEEDHREDAMEIRIGIQQSPRELTIETDQKTDGVRKLIEQAYADADTQLLSLTDSKDRQYLIPLESISYIEFGGTESRKVGFVS
ncbi:MAG: DUF3107 domain-containing protein [Canibacter sp.]